MHIPFSLTPLDGGHSGAELYCAAAVGQRFLVKIFPEEFDQKRLDRISEICQLYQNLEIPSLTLVKFGKVKTGGHPYCFYNYIDGDNYEVAGERCTEAENYRVGYKVGTWLGILKNTKPPAKLKSQEENLSDLIRRITTAYFQLFTNPTLVCLMCRYFDLATLLRFGEDLAQLSQPFAYYTKHLIHGDIKRSNIMLDPAGKIWLVDIESMKMSYDIMNFRHQMTWFLSAKNTGKTEFLRGVFDGLYKNTRPIDFQQQLIFVTLLNFCEYTAHHAHELDTLQEYFERMQPIIPQLLAGEIRV